MDAVYFLQVTSIDERKERNQLGVVTQHNLMEVWHSTPELFQEEYLAEELLEGKNLPQSHIIQRFSNGKVMNELEGISIWHSSPYRIEKSETIKKSCLCEEIDLYLSWFSRNLAG